MRTAMRAIRPDMWALAAILLAIATEWLVPVGPAPGLLAPLSWIGAAIAVAGLALEIWSARTLARAGTTTKPNADPAALVTTGPFARSRNPFYLGLLLVLIGAFLAFGLEWGVAFTAGVWLALDRLVIPAEEARLSAAFGDDFARYARTVRRWL
jgi:protein-S-isoprenylcysteine O-methyltransferase Ste14